MGTSLAYAARDSHTMLRRNLRRMQRYPMMTLTLIGIPVIFLLLFVYVFGGTIGAGLAESSGGRAEYANYVARPSFPHRDDWDHARKAGGLMLSPRRGPGGPTRHMLRDRRWAFDWSSHPVG